jgi:predicted Fe-Mo cluster-binding NifX family protein
MKICITAKGAGMNSLFESRFARAPYLIFYDTDSGDYEAVRNALVLAEGRIRQSAVSLLSLHLADMLITGSVGMNARESLRSAAIRVNLHNGTGTVGKVLCHELGKADPGQPKLQRVSRSSSVDQPEPACTGADRSGFGLP